MKTRLEQVLYHYLNGREIAVWGNPTRSMLRALKSNKYHIADIVDPVKHYVVAVTHEDFDDFVKDEQSDGFKFIDDCTYAEEDGELPFEWECLEDVPPYAVVAGVPAKIKSYRFSPEMIETLLRIKWWDWSADEINANAEALMSPNIFMKRFRK